MPHYFVTSLLRFSRLEAEADVVGGPLAFGVAKFGAERFLDLSQVSGALGGRKGRREVLGEGIVTYISANASTVFITYSRIEMYAGDYAEIE